MTEETTGTDQQPETSETAEKATSSSEAAKYRRRLREAEEQRDALQQQLEALQAEAVNTAVSGVLEGADGRKVQLKEPADLFLFTQTAATDYLTETGTVDHEKLSAAAQQLAERRPELLQQPNKVIIPNVGDTPSGAPRVTFAGAFAPASEN